MAKKTLTGTDFYQKTVQYVRNDICGKIVDKALEDGTITDPESALVKKLRDANFAEEFYQSAYRAALRKDGEIDKDENKLLNSLAEQLGIDEVAKQDLEKEVNKDLAYLTDYLTGRTVSKK